MILFSAESQLTIFTGTSPISMVVRISALAISISSRKAVAAVAWIPLSCGAASVSGIFFFSICRSGFAFPAADGIIFPAVADAASGVCVPAGSCVGPGVTVTGFSVAADSAASVAGLLSCAGLLSWAGFPSGFPFPSGVTFPSGAWLPSGLTSGVAVTWGPFAEPGSCISAGFSASFTCRSSTSAAGDGSGRLSGIQHTGVASVLNR